MLSDKVGEKVCVVYEATGIYTHPLQRFLEKMISNNISFRRQNLPENEKNVSILKKLKLDPIAISKVYYDRQENEVEDDKFHRMKQLNRLYEDKINHLRKYKVTFQNSLSICFPGFLDLFNDGYSGLAMVILKKYPHPDLIKISSGKRLPDILKNIHVIKKLFP